ncbi:MAG: phage minor head protein [Clostridia bacterium]|nr:phage minor head protein [Clostridia bacterium]
MADVAHIVLEPLPFQEAMDYWRSKVVMTPEEFRRLADAVKVNAFTVADMAGLDMLNEVWRLLDKAIAEGLTINEFREKAGELFKARGWEGATPYRLDNIFRTNIQTAFNVGRYKQMTEPDILQARPIWVYDAVNDRRTRPTHLALDGTARRADDPFWDTWYPPNGYRCRCAVRNLSEREARRRGVTVQTGAAPGLVEPPGQPARPLIPDPGFDFNPGKEAWKPDLTRYPAPLREAYQKRLAERSG